MNPNINFQSRNPSPDTCHFNNKRPNTHSHYNVPYPKTKLNVNLTKIKTNNSVNNENVMQGSPTLVEDVVTSWSLRSFLSPNSSSALASANTIPSKKGLSDIPLEQLNSCLDPILDGLQDLDAEDLLQLERVHTNGATLREGYGWNIVY